MDLTSLAEHLRRVTVEVTDADSHVWRLASVWNAFNISGPLAPTMAEFNQGLRSTIQPAGAAASWGWR